MSFLAHAMRPDLMVVQTATTLGIVTFAQAGPWEQCGGINWKGATSCVSGFACTVANVDFPQCVPDTLTATNSAMAELPPHAASELPSAPTDGPSKKTGKTPALGWNSWNAYRCNISESRILAAANEMVSLGLKDAGYEYVNIDDCWSELVRDPTTNRIVPDKIKFPNGIATLATQIHDLSLKIGIYSDAGTETCAEYPASLGFEDIDAATFSDWGIDYLKYDNCNVPANWTDTELPPHNNWYESNSAIRYRQMAGALATHATRPIQLDLCIWGTAHVWEWGAKVGHSWRMSGDSTPDWNYIRSIISTNVAHLSAVDFFAHNDMDMMEIGNGNLTIEEERTHFAAWCFMKSPILLGTDLDTLTQGQLDIITNRDLLAFHQDAEVGTPAKPIGTNHTDPPEFYSGHSSKGTHVFIINTGNSTATKSFKFKAVPGLTASSSYLIHDMWTGRDVVEFSDAYAVAVAAHDTVALRVVPV